MLLFLAYLVGAVGVSRVQYFFTVLRNLPHFWPLRILSIKVRILYVYYKVHDTWSKINTQKKPKQ